MDSSLATSIPSAPSFFTKQMLARPQDAVVAALDQRGGLCRLGMQVGEVRLAEGALDHLEVELQVTSQVGIESVKQIATELLTRRAGEPSSAPDRSQCVQVGIAAV